MSFTIFFPNQLQRQMSVTLQLLMNLAEVYSRPFRRPRPYRSSGKQQFVEALLVAIFGQRPAEPGCDRFLQIPMNGRLTNRATTGNLILPKTQSEPET
jgi:hypothetical protein